MKPRSSTKPSLSLPRLPSLSIHSSPPLKSGPLRPASRLKPCFSSPSLHPHPLASSEDDYFPPTLRVRLPPIAGKLLPPTAAYRDSVRIPRLTKRFAHMEDVLTRIPCEDFLSSLLNREPYADNALVVNLAKVRERTHSDEALTEDSGEETDSD